MTGRYLLERPTLLGALLIAAVLARHAQAAPLMLPSGEPDPNCPELRLWLRADSGIKDTEGHGPEAPAFNGRVAAWKDRSPQKFDLTAEPGQTPLFVERQPAAGNRPALAFSGEQILTRDNAVLYDRPTSTMVLVAMGQPKRGNHPTIYCVGQDQGRRERLSMVFGRGINPALERLSGLHCTDAGEREFHLDLRLPGDGRAGGRFAVILVNGDTDCRSVEFHDGLSGPAGGERSTAYLGAKQSACDKCKPVFRLGGDMEESFCGQIAETMVFNRSLTVAERKELLKYLRRRYELDMADGLFPPDTFLLPAEDFDGNWKRVQTQLPAEGAQYLRRQHVTAEGKEADEGIKTTIQVLHKGNYHVWVRAHESGFNAQGPGSRSALKTIVQGKELRVTHVRGPGDVVWREAGEAELKAGPVEVVVRGDGPGRKDCDCVLISPTAATPEQVEEICVLACRLRRVGGAAHLTAVFDGGLRLDGSLVTGWRWMGPSGQVPRPDPATMPSLACLQFDRRRSEPERPSAVPAEPVLEFQNGDRLRGAIVGYVPASKRKDEEASALLVIQPKTSPQDPKDTISVEVDWLRGIVFEPQLQDRPCPPKTLIRRDGRRCVFRALRWGADSVSVLTDESLERIPLGEVAALRLAPVDAWDAYYRELAILDPECKTGVVRVETTDGIVVTASTTGSPSIFRAQRRRPGAGASGGGGGGRGGGRGGGGGGGGQRRHEYDQSQRLMQPVWSRQPIPVRWSDIRLLWQAPPHVVPLSRFAPEQVVQRGTLGSSWRWQTDRNAAGGILRSGGLDHLWGFGVHAPCEMVFSLPDCVRAFRASVGIDDVVGRAGRAAAKVYLGEAAGAPLYQSDPLVGSRGAVSTGEVALPMASGRRLVLATEASGDPLDIGDHVDWLEPTLLLDPARLREEVTKRQPPEP